MNKYCVSYNVFDGVELLEDSINQIKDFVDYITIIFQTESYWGNKLTQSEIDIVLKLKENGLINDIFHYKNNIHIEKAQTYKRNLGLKMARENGCTHYMTMDCDEFYTKDDFKTLIDYHEKNTDVVSYIPLEAYYKNTKYMINSEKYMDGDLYVSGFFPVTNDITFNYPLNIKVDPTRKPNISNENKIKIWNKSEIMMHHLSYIRADIYKKINNAFAKFRYKDNQQKFQNIVQCYQNYETNKVALSADGEEYDIKTLDIPYIILDKYYKNIKYIKK